jgi:hypothetical protein
MVGKDDKDGQIQLLRKALRDMVEALDGHWHDDLAPGDFCEDCDSVLVDSRYVGARHLDEISEIAKNALLETTF